MPPFSSPQASSSNIMKRKADDTAGEGSRKRQASASVGQSGGAAYSSEQYWMVQWRHPQQRKHKTWEGDGILVVGGSGRATLMDEDGKIMCSGKISTNSTVDVGQEMQVGGREIEVDRAIPRADYLSGACFGRGPPLAATGASSSTSAILAKKFATPRVTTPSAAMSFKAPSTSGTSNAPPNSLESGKVNLTEDGTQESCWTVNWRKPQQKKHKTWDGDAFLVLRSGKMTLISEAGKILGSKPFEGARLYTGLRNYISGREIEIDVQIPRSKIPAITGASYDIENDPDPEPFTPSQSSPSRVNSTVREKPSSASLSVPSSSSVAKKVISPVSFYAAPPAPKKAAGPLHNPEAEGAVVLTAPDDAHSKKFNRKNMPVVPVVVDPFLARKLRPHQIEGVKFLYECVMGMRKHEGQGCILADDMGLGKTLQTIALIWTLLKQNPYANSGPIVHKVLIVCPVTLARNWRKEFHHWLGRDRVGIMMGEDNKKIKQFVNSKTHHVLIIGYERLRNMMKDLQYCSPPIDLIVCDEGHRLKSANNKTTAMFDALSTKRKIILSGTPIQNDLSEFHTMANFCNPGLLDEYSTFRRVYELPILRSRMPECSEKDVKLGNARSTQLQEITRSFVLRRDASTIKAFLPPKHEYVVFITPTALQLALFSKILNPDKLDNLIHNASTIESLAMITTLTKICNSPILIKAVADATQSKSDGGSSARATTIREAVKLIPSGAQVEDVALSGKLTALATMLNTLKRETDEKCILVSHYTSTLNVLQRYCEKKKYSFLRLDGSTPTAKRQQNVNEFNGSRQDQCFLFLLSSKAGGVGLNLIGASRLFLIDSDWNPSHDLQSMARIHRDGQKREVYIYRLMTTGTIDEKIYQRQVTKLGLSSTLIGNGKSGSKSDSFTPKELRDIFTVHPHTLCHTHELLDCRCDQFDDADMVADLALTDEISSDGEEVRNSKFVPASQVPVGKADRAELKRKKAALAALGEWRHINCSLPNARENITDEILLRLLETGISARQSDAGSSTKKNRISSLLEAVDLERISTAPTEDLRAGNVPGGSLSFLFERRSGTVDEDEGDNEEDDEQVETEPTDSAMDDD